MKKFLWVAALMMVLMGCSGTAESWPKEIKGKDYTVTRVDTTFEGSTYNNAMQMSYLSLTEEQIVQDSSLIAKLEITEEPVEYKTRYLRKGIAAGKTMLAYKAKVVKVYYTDSTIKEGDTVKFIRQEFTEKTIESKIVRYTDNVTIKLTKNMYILFLENYDSLIKENEEFSTKYGVTNSASAFNSIAPYISTDPCRKIIICGDDSNYSFDQVFTTLSVNAEENTQGVGMVMLDKKDINFDENIQSMIDKYSKK